MDVPEPSYLPCLFGVDSNMSLLTCSQGEETEPHSPDGTCYRRGWHRQDRRLPRFSRVAKSAGGTVYLAADVHGDVCTHGEETRHRRMDRMHGPSPLRQCSQGGIVRRLAVEQSSGTSPFLQVANDWSFPWRA